MKPVVITFVDDKMLPYAEAQAENVKQFGLEHRIFRLNDVDAYSPALWLRMFDLTVESIIEHGKIFRLDAEVRLQKPLPQSWLDNDNVFFQPYPYTKWPYYVMNTGQIIIGKSGLEFCRMFKECMLSLIPPTSTVDDTDFYFDDEFPANFALRLSGVNFVQEYLQLDRRDFKECSANRGIWINESTVLTHPTLHNWSYQGAAMFPSEGKVNEMVVINHFEGEVDLATMVTKLVIDRNAGNIWNKIAEKVNDSWYFCGNWYFEPSTGLCAPAEAWPSVTKQIDPAPLRIKMN